MICIRCEATEFETRDEVIEQELGKDTIEVKTPASVCRMCGWVTVTLDQADELLKRTIQEYAKLKANRAKRPEPEIGRTYRSKSTGSLAKLTRIHSDGVEMQHSTKCSRQSWNTFFTWWKPI